jgi:hypothetical protein
LTGIWIAPLLNVSRKRPVTTAVLLVVALIVWPATQAEAQTEPDEAQAAREEKARTLQPHRRSVVERALFALEDDLLLQRWFDPPRGVFVRVGNMGEGAGFALGPAFRYNTPTYDFKTSAAGSLKKYFTGEASIRFPGTLGTNDYFKRRGPYLEVYARHRDFPQEDFFGLGPDSQVSDRSDYAVRDQFGRVSAGYERGLFEGGVGLGYLAASIGAGQDKQMPSSTEIFTPAEMPGVLDRTSFLVVEPFVELRTMDRAVNDQSGGVYRVSFSQYRDQDHGRYSFTMWQADLRQYVAFLEDTHVIALRGWAASTNPDAGDEVPFYLQPTLGGARTLRGYHTFRFRDRSALSLQAEYRWKLNAFLNAALFYDAGAVAATISDLGRFERNYGFGFRAGGRWNTALRFDVAFGGREGTRWLVRFDDVF